MARGIYQRDPIIRETRRQAQLARWRNPVMREKMLTALLSHPPRRWNKGMKMDILKYPNWGLRGKHHPGQPGCRKGSKASIETREKLRKSHQGNRHYNWRGGKTSLPKRIRRLQEYNRWRVSILQRDNNRCVNCGNQNRLHVDHKISLGTLIEQFLAAHNYFDPHLNKEELVKAAYNWKPFWDIANGRTLCPRCHRDR